MTLEKIIAMWYNIITASAIVEGKQLAKKGKEKMTVADALKNASINFEEIGMGIFKGLTTKGKRFYMYRACGACGLKFTLCIEGMNTATRCILRKAIQKIKKN